MCFASAIQVMKKSTRGLLIPSMTCKAWNGRLVLQWLAACLHHATSRLGISKGPKRLFVSHLLTQVRLLAAACRPLAPVGAGRLLGHWRGLQAAPPAQDPKMPVEAFAMNLADNYSKCLVRLRCCAIGVVDLIVSCKILI